MKNLQFITFLWLIHSFSLTNICHANPKIDLLNCAYSGDKSCVENALSNSADINYRDPEGTSALSLAIEQGHDHIVKLLINRGADLEVEVYHDGKSPTPLMLALGTNACPKSKSLPIARMLINAGADVKAKRDDGRTALMLAAALADSATLKLLISKGADINAQSKKGSTPLMDASKKGNDETTKFLIENGAEINVKDYQKTTPLISAVFYGGNIEVVKLLVENGADIEARNITRATPLHLACAVEEPKIEIVRYLIAKGADVNACSPNFKGLHPLGAAMVNGYAEIKSVLLEAGAELEWDCSD